MPRTAAAWHARRQKARQLITAEASQQASKRSQVFAADVGGMLGTVQFDLIHLFACFLLLLFSLLLPSSFLSLSRRWCSEGIVAIAANTLRILTIERLGELFNQQQVLLVVHLGRVTFCPCVAALAAC
jgi:hypothetical protein